MKQLSYIFLYILCILILQCSGNEKSKIVDIYPDGSPKEIEVYKGNPPKMELNKILHISSFGDTSMIVNIEDGDTLIPEINKEIIKSKFKNGQSMIVDHWKIRGHSETLIEIHYFDETGDILKIDDKVNNRVKKYAELHPELERWDKPENNPLKNYLHGCMLNLILQEKIFCQNLKVGPMYFQKLIKIVIKFGKKYMVSIIIGILI